MRSHAERLLIAIGILIVAVSGWLTFISPSFEIESPFLQRPVIAVVATLITASIFWLLSCWLVGQLGSESRKRMLWWIIGVGIVSRIVLLGSTPILEIDLYRYIWDGRVTALTGNPYKYAPIEFAYHEDRITFSRDQSDGFEIAILEPNDDEALLDTIEILSQHYGEFTSPYPPVSQAIFAAAHNCCPRVCRLKRRVVTMKMFMVLFEFATGIVLILILRTLKLPETMSIVWFWSPLALKEFANSGHLDSIAIFFCSLFVLFALKQFSNQERTVRYAMIASVSLSLAIAAKIFPVVLFPIWAFATLCQLRVKALLPIVSVVCLTVAMLLPMLLSVLQYQNRDSKSLPQPGILAFAQSWEINDFLFMVVLENLKPPVDVGNSEANASPWFVVVPDTWRTDTTFDTAFSTTRWITTIMLAGITLWLAWRWTKTESKQLPHLLAEAVFLILAWFWFLSPTQNPWYWCWALPFVPFAKSRIWYAVAVMTLLYYLRPWFTFHRHDIAGFDNTIPIVEFAPILVLLFVSFLQSSLSRAKIEGKMEVSGKS